MSQPPPPPRPLSDPPSPPLSIHPWGTPSPGVVGNGILCRPAHCGCPVTPDVSATVQRSAVLSPAQFSHI